MKLIITFICLFFVIGSSPVQAEWGYAGMPYPTTETEPKPLGEVIAKPRCFDLINKTEHSVRGTVETNEFIRGDGVKSRWRQNFWLKETGDKANFCTTGPFYDGGKVQLVIRTLIPIFSCFTTVGEDVIIRSKRREDDRGYKVWAECH